VLRILGLVPVLCAAGACFHHQAYLPGVIDLRSDGSGLRAAGTHLKDDPRVTRTGADALTQGAGLSIVGNEMRIEERHFWLAGSIPILNESPTPELEAALAAGGALTHLEIGEELGAIDAVAYLFVPMVVPMSGWVLPSYTWVARGRPARIDAIEGGGPPQELR
jgi:hypothetical protein